MDVVQHEKTSRCTDTAIPGPHNATDTPINEKDHELLQVGEQMTDSSWHGQRSSSSSLLADRKTEFTTQTVNERCTQTGDDLLRGVSDVEGLDRTRLQHDDLCSDRQTYTRSVVRDETQSTLDSRLLVVQTPMVDVALQTKITNSAQTPLQGLSLGNIPDDLPLTCSRNSTVPRLLTSPAGRHEVRVVQDCGSQFKTDTLTQSSQAFTSATYQLHTSHAIESMARHEDKVKNRDRDKKKESEGHQSRGHQSIVNVEDCARSSADEHCKCQKTLTKTNEKLHQHRRNKTDSEERKKLGRSKRHRHQHEVKVNSNQCSSGLDVNSTDLLKMMLHQIKDLRNKASFVSGDSRESNARNHWNRRDSRSPDREGTRPQQAEKLEIHADDVSRKKSHNYRQRVVSRGWPWHHRTKSYTSEQNRSDMNAEDFRGTRRPSSYAYFPERRPTSQYKPRQSAVTGPASETRHPPQPHDPLSEGLVRDLQYVPPLIQKSPVAAENRVMSGTFQPTPNALQLSSSIIFVPESELITAATSSRSHISGKPFEQYEAEQKASKLKRRNLPSSSSLRDYRPSLLVSAERQAKMMKELTVSIRNNISLMH